MMPSRRSGLQSWQAWMITLLTSTLGGATAVAAAWSSQGRRRAARRVLACGLPVGVALCLGLGALPLAWGFIAAIFLACNLILGGVLAWLVGRQPATEPVVASPGDGSGWSTW